MIQNEFLLIMVSTNGFEDMKLLKDGWQGTADVCSAFKWNEIFMVTWFYLVFIAESMRWAQ